MPTIMSHAIVPLAAALALGPSRISRPMMITGALLAMAPDADVIGFPLGIEYAATWGHRGATHSLFFAAVVAAVLTAMLRPDRKYLGLLFLTISMASHGVLDAFTSGGLGPALFWPVDEARHFAPVRPIRVSPIGVGFFSARGVAVMVSEMLWIWLPAIAIGMTGYIWRIKRKTT
jgi:inner membrane protein